MKTTGNIEEKLVGAVGIEPTTFGLKGRCSTTELRPYIVEYQLLSSTNPTALGKLSPNFFFVKNRDNSFPRGSSHALPSSMILATAQIPACQRC